MESQTSASPVGHRPAVFFDRDGTLIEDVPYLGDPSKVRLMKGAWESIVRLHEAGFACVVVSNQSGIGRGMISESQYRAVNEAMCELLAKHGAKLDAIYHCPHSPLVRDETVVEDVNRKPGPGMLQRAAREMLLDLSQSWMIGDKVSDVLAGRNAGCRCSLLLAGDGGARENEIAALGAVDRFEHLSEAVDYILDAAATRTSVRKAR